MPGELATLFADDLKSLAAPCFLFSARQLVENNTVTWDQIADLWAVDALSMSPVGRRGTSPFENRSSWTQVVRADRDLDILISPRLRHCRGSEDLEEFMLLALLRYFLPVKVPTLKQVNNLAKSLWDLRRCQLLRLADKSDLVEVTRRGRVEMSPRLQLVGLPLEKRVAMRGLEDQFCAFLAEAGNGSAYFSIASLAYSFHRFAWRGQGSIALAFELASRIRKDRHFLTPTNQIFLSETASDIRVRLARNETSYAVALQDLDATKGSHRYRDSIKRYGVAFPVDLCGDFPWCEKGCSCQLAHCPSLVGRDYIQGLSGCHSGIRPAALQKVFETAMSQGRLRIPESDVLREWQGLQGNEDLGSLEEELEALQSSGRLMVLRVARTASTVQCHSDEGRFARLLSPRLCSVNSWLLGCLMAFLRHEHLSASFAMLSSVALHYFGVKVPRDAWRRIAFQNRERFQIGQLGTSFVTEKSRRYKLLSHPREDVAKRQADMDAFIAGFMSECGADLPEPLLPCMIESARRYGPPRFRSDRLRALWDLLRSATAGRWSNSHRSTSGSVGLADSSRGLADSASPGNDPCIGLFRKQVFPAPPTHLISAHSSRISERPLPDQIRHKRDTYDRVRPPNRSEMGKTANRRRAIVRLPPHWHVLSDIVLTLLYKLSPVVTQQNASRLLAACGCEAEPWPTGHIPRGLLVARVVGGMVEPHSETRLSRADSALLAQALAGANPAYQHERRQLVGLLRRHEGLRGELKVGKVGGSMQYGLGIPGSDHDLHIEVFNGTEHMASHLCKVVKALQPTCHDFPVFANATLECFEYGVRVLGFPFGVEWDLVPVTARAEFGGDLCQYDNGRRAWKPMLSTYLVPELQSWSQNHTDFFLAVRLLKMWNAQLPALRQHRCAARGGVADKRPLSSFHLVLLAAAARREGFRVRGVSEALLGLLRFARRHWRNKTLETGVPTASEHVQRIIEGYDLELSPKLAELDGYFLRAERTLVEMMGTNDELHVLGLAYDLFGSMGPGDAEHAAASME